MRGMVGMHFWSFTSSEVDESLLNLGDAMDWFLIHARKMSSEAASRSRLKGKLQKQCITPQQWAKNMEILVN